MAIINKIIYDGMELIYNNDNSLLYVDNSLNPLYDTMKVTDIGFIANNCYNVQSGALALYQQASTQTNPPAIHYNAFTNCGINTQQGAAELAQIPSDWK